jgi:UDP-N-acetylglucosamine diphosphorylase / glucose-1-phosphate thymidylyltransferase / UDP-N-acetylgalactosamine diphosphorylase / glucosamine-1-phosphate N-acetyltransferase / galactosamine-1-phosphate N-acetyltransferase
MKQAVILAAGEGQRLRPFTVNKSKVMLTIAGKPILQHVIESLAQNGIYNIVVIVGYHSEQIFNFFSEGENFGVNISYKTQQKQLGTAHAIEQAKGAIEGDFLILPGDNLIDRDTIAQFTQIKPWAMLITRTENPFRSSVVKVENNYLKEATLKEKRVSGPSLIAGTHCVNTGIYSVNSDIFDIIDNELDIPDVFNKMISENKKIAAIETEGTWLDVIYPWDILRLNDVILRNTQKSLGGKIEPGVHIKGNVLIGEKTIIRANSYIIGPVIIGGGCDIGPNVCLMPSTSIGNNVAISPFTEIKNSIIGDDVSVGPSSIIQDSVIDGGCTISGNFTACSDNARVIIGNECHLLVLGALLGKGCRLESGVTARPGVTLGNQCHVKAHRLIEGVIPDRSLLV